MRWLNWEEYLEAFKPLSSSLDAKVGESLHVLATDQTGYGRWYQYLIDFKNRFRTSTYLIDNYCGLNSGSRVHEVGGHGPYILYYLHLKYGLKPEMSDIVDSSAASSIEWLTYSKLNLCRDDLTDRYDLIICEEVLEHMPCDLIPAIRKLVNHIKDGGFLLVSVPLGRAGWNVLKGGNILLPIDGIHGHLREFENGEIKGLVGLPTVAEALVRDKPFQFMQLMLFKKGVVTL